MTTLTSHFRDGRAQKVGVTEVRTMLDRPIQGDLQIVVLECQYWIPRTTRPADERQVGLTREIHK